MSEGMLQLMWAMVEVLAPVATALAVWLGVRVSSWIKSKTQHEKTQGILLRMNDFIWAVVSEQQQLFVDGIKAARAADSDAGSEVSKAELAQIKKQAVDQIKTLAGPRGLRELAKILGFDEFGVERWISAKVETAVRDLKTRNP